MTMVYLASSTVSGGTSVGFTLPSGYDIFEFYFDNVYTNRQACCTTGIDSITFGLSFSAGGNYRTTTYIRAYNFDVDNTSATIGYEANDADNDYGAQKITNQLGATNHSGLRGSGVVRLYDPFSTSSIKHFTTRSQSRYRSYYGGNYSTSEVQTAGYYHNTSAVASVSFGIQYPSSNYLYGDFYMYGIK